MNIKELDNAIAKKSNITLVDRLNSVGENIADNSPVFVVGAITLGIIGAATYFGFRAHDLLCANEGFSNAQNYMGHIKAIADTSLSMGKSLPLTSEMIAPVNDFMLKSTNSDLFAQAKGVFQGVTNLQQMLTTNHSASVTNLLNNVSSGLEPLASRGQGYIASSVITGIIGVIAGFIEGACISDASWTDHNEDKKELKNWHYRNFRGRLNKALKDGSIDENTANNVIKYLVEVIKANSPGHIRYIFETTGSYLGLNPK